MKRGQDTEDGSVFLILPMFAGGWNRGLRMSGNPGEQRAKQAYPCRKKGRRNMKLAANYGVYREKSERNPHVASLEFLHKAGFESMDINLHGAIVPGHYLGGDNWRREI